MMIKGESHEMAWAAMEKLRIGKLADLHSLPALLLASNSWSG